MSIAVFINLMVLVACGPVRGSGMNPSIKPLPAAQRLRCEYMVNPEGVDRLQPRLSWQMAPLPGATGQKTTAYRVLVASDREILARNTGDLWDTGKTVESQPVCLAYAGKTLRSMQSCFWKVKLWNETGDDLGWSEAARWAMGVLDRDEWRRQWLAYVPERVDDDPFAGEWFDKARWIWSSEKNPRRPPAGTRFFQREFTVDNPRNIEWAQMIFAAQDGFTLAINGKSLTREKIRMKASGPVPRFDLKPYLVTGKNTILATAEKLAPRYEDPNIQQVAGIIGVIKIQKKGGALETIVTDENWSVPKSAFGAWSSARDRAQAGGDNKSAARCFCC